MRHAFLLLALGLVLPGCQSCGGTPRPAPVIPADSDDCPAACDRLAALGCEEGAPLPPSAEHPQGQSCADWCRESQGNGHSLRPSCVKKIAKCADLDRVQTQDDCPFR